MKKDINDYLPLYMGSPYRYSYVEDPELFTAPVKLTPFRLVKLDDMSIAKVQLILRPLSSMTEDEAKEFSGCPNDWRIRIIEGRYIDCWPDGDAKSMVTIELDEINAEQFRFLLSKGFDLFGLIDSAIAVNAETLK